MKIGEFYRSLSNSFQKTFPILRKYFEEKSYGKISESLERKLNDTAYNFLIRNVFLGDGWDKEYFDKYIELFIEEINKI